MFTLPLPFISRISSWFGRRSAPTKGASSFHKGIDLPAPEGTPVFAASDGVIEVREHQRGYGNVVYIRHADGSQTRYGHMSGFTDIRPGQTVHGGEQIGFVGSTGVSTGPHLHLEYRDVSGKAIDPQFILNGTLPPEFVLKPKMPNTKNAYQYNTLTNNQNFASAPQSLDDTISISYQSNCVGVTELTKNAPDKKPGFFEGLIELLTGNEEERKDLFDPPSPQKAIKPVNFTLSKTDMKKKGFTDEQIEAIERLSVLTNTNRRLGLAGQVISEKDLREIGIDEFQIQMLNALETQKAHTA